MSDSRLVVGVMTGTSMDGMDAALVEIAGRGLGMKVGLKGFVSRPLGEVAKRLRAAAEQTPMTAGEFARLMHDFAIRHVEVIGELLGSTKADLIAVHGQTVFHAPPVSWQLINPAPIEAAFGCPVMSDLRAADLARGGEGAPLTPLADWVMFRSASKHRAIVNLGGFCNVTVLPKSCGPDEVRGFDCCACNQILDHLAQTRLGCAFDEGGNTALSAEADQTLLPQLGGTLVHQSDAGRSLGTGDELRDEVSALLGKLSPAAALSTAVTVIAATVAMRLDSAQVEEIIVSGGSARNRALVNRISQYSKRLVVTTAEIGIPIDAREAVAWAVLGALSADGVPVALSEVTFCREPAVAGSICGFSKFPT